MKKLLVCFVLILLAGLTLVGCSGPDDLQVTNNYSFTIRLRDKNEEIGTVAPGSTRKFAGKGGFHGNGLDYLRYEDESGKKLGIVDDSSLNASFGDASPFNGAGIWSVTVGP